MRRPTDPSTGERAIVYIVLLTGAVLMIGPFLWMILSAFKANSEIIAVPPTFLPIEATLENFLGIRTRFAFMRLFANSLYVAAVKTTVIVYIAALVGTVFGKYRFPGRDVFFATIIATMMIPWPVTIIPLYQLMLSLRLIGTYTAIILPFSLNQ
jgi:multiple sugar transport system permease protein